MRPLPQQTITKLLNWYIAQPELERKECHLEQRRRLNVLMNEARKAGEKIEADGELYYHAFLDGLQKRCRLQSNRKLRTADDLEAITAQRISIEKAKIKAKPSPKLDRLHGNLAPVVERLRREGLSWKKVSDYLAKYHKCKISRGYLQDVFADR